MLCPATGKMIVILKSQRKGVGKVGNAYARVMIERVVCQRELAKGLCEPLTTKNGKSGPTEIKALLFSLKCNGSCFNEQSSSTRTKVPREPSPTSINLRAAVPKCLYCVSARSHSHGSSFVPSI